MDLIVGITVLGVLFGVLALGVWVAISLIIVAGVSLVLFTNVPMGQLLATSAWSSVGSYPLTALPLFIWMGEILTRSRLSADLFNGLAPWMRRFPGGLVHVNIFGCGLFAAVSGSSAATCATVGRMAVPELRERGYEDRMILGTLAGSATLGLLIPPSIILIVYGVATEQSIARLFIAGVIPGIVLLTLFVSYVALRSLLQSTPDPAKAEPELSFANKVSRSRRLIPVTLLIIGVIGSIYGGVASPTDAAAVGIALSLVFVWLSGDLSWDVFREGIKGATRTSCMICLIVVGASFLTAAMGFVGLPRNLAIWIGELGLSRFELIAALTLFFIVVGCFLDGVSIVLLTTAILLPLVETVGIDPIWFGIYLVIAVEMSQITPPVGFNLFVIQSLSGADIFRIARASMPFFMIMLLFIMLITILPDIATWLPRTMMAR